MSILDQLKALCAAREKASAGKWECYEDAGKISSDAQYKQNGMFGLYKTNSLTCSEYCSNAGDFFNPHDVAFITAAANLDYPRLIAMVERYEAALQKIANRPDLPNPERDADWKNCMKWSAHEAREALAKETP